MTKHENVLGLFGDFRTEQQGDRVSRNPLSTAIYRSVMMTPRFLLDLDKTYLRTGFRRSPPIRTRPTQFFQHSNLSKQICMGNSGS